MLVLITRIILSPYKGVWNTQSTTVANQVLAGEQFHQNLWKGYPVTPTREGAHMALKTENARKIGEKTVYAQNFR